MNDFMIGAKFLFDTGWQMLTVFNIPGVNFTPLAALFFSAFVVLILNLIRSIIGRTAGGYRRFGSKVSSPPSTTKK